jgi:3-methyladenine DNA glycosylase AlkD
MTKTSNLAKKSLRRFASLDRKKSNEWFFKTEKGQYGEGDKFIGVSMPNLRIVASEYIDLSLDEIKKLLNSPIHEDRLLALVILTLQFKKIGTQEQKTIYNFYLKNTKRINNWDLVDISAHKIVGAYLLDKPKGILKKLARSKNMWERRIAMVSTWMFISKGETKDVIEIATILKDDEHDLMHKAVGWMLREVGKKEIKKLEKFLKRHYKTLPRTMLRYAIERFPEEKRQNYLRGTI